MPENTPFDVCVDELLDGCVVSFEERAQVAFDPGVVEPNVDVSAVRCGLLSERRHLSVLGDISSHERRSTARGGDGPHRLVPVLLASPGHVDVRPFSGERPGSRESDPRTTPGDHRHLSVELCHRRLPSLPNDPVEPHRPTEAHLGPNRRLIQTRDKGGRPAST
jgi:hypothetical protein